MSRDEQPETPGDRQLADWTFRCFGRPWPTTTGSIKRPLGYRNHSTEIRSLAAWLAKRHTATTLRELASRLGLGRAQSVGIFQATGFFRLESDPSQPVLPLVGLAAKTVIRDRHTVTRRVDGSLTKSKAFRRTIQEIEAHWAAWQREKAQTATTKKELTDPPPSFTSVRSTPKLFLNRSASVR